ncbi:Crp/Fnr family transcriptional regulator [Cytophaga aurantiaca]|uniref:Crp/Fnr family transcriptional regulator n=1 Tax=Cytophaga aurantiaca TaxID=29530 RepID=UPI00037FB2D0|nr:Crp/Fnr family transcriptional regulator [Cytophaga aurantiaca]
MISSIDQLRQLVTSIHPFTDKEWNRFASLWKPFEAKRKEQLTIPGQTEKYLYFVVEGVQRVFYFDDQNREATLVFTYAPSFGGVLDSMIHESPSKYYYETLTPSTFLRASFSEIEVLSKEIIGIEILIRKGTVQALSGVLERLVEVQSFTSEERFKKLLQRSPHILQLVPHKYLASYLGIDPTNFSKLINKVKI